MPRVYATAEQLAAYPGGSTVPEDSAPDFLILASAVVDLILVGRVYAVDDDGLPTDTDVADSLQRAVCAIVVESYATGALSQGATLQWESVAIGSVQLSNLQGASVSDPIVVMGLPIPPAAIIALSSVGYALVVQC